MYNKLTLVVEESMHVVFDESNSLDKNCENCTDHPTKRKAPSNEEKDETNAKSKESHHDLPKEITIIKDHPNVQVIGDYKKGNQLILSP